MEYVIKSKLKKWFVDNLNKLMVQMIVILNEQSKKMIKIKTRKMYRKQTLFYFIFSLSTVRLRRLQSEERGGGFYIIGKVPNKSTQPCGANHYFK